MKYFIRSFTIALLTIPFIGLAASSGIVQCSGVDDCNFSTLVSTANKIINFCVVIGTSIFALVFMYAGWLYLTSNGNTGQVSKAHGYFMDAIIGYSITLAAWLFIDLILDSLVKSSGNYRLLEN